MKADDMLTFLAVAESGSFTKAAEVLMTPKSNISRKVFLEWLSNDENRRELGRCHHRQNAFVALGVPLRKEDLKSN